MRVVRAAGQNVSPSDDGRLFDQIFSDGLFTDTTFTNLGGNSVQVGAMYGDLCGRDFTIEQMTLTVTLPEGEGEVTGYIYVEIDTSSDDVITLNSALAPFTPTYEDINTNGAIAQMILAEYTATAVAVTGVTPVYERAAASAVKAGSIATVESAQATQNHAVGDYILLNGQLYVVTAAVNTGETFVEGTNISAAVIGDTLTALNNGLTNIESYSFTAMGTKMIYVYKMGRLVFIDSPYDATSAPSGQNIIGTLPEKYRPIRLMRSPIANNSNSPWFAQIETDGKMMVYVNREITSATNMAFSFMYFSAS